MPLWQLCAKPFFVCFWPETCGKFWFHTLYIKINRRNLYFEISQKVSYYHHWKINFSILQKSKFDFKYNQLWHFRRSIYDFVKNLSCFFFSVGYTGQSIWDNKLAMYCFQVSQTMMAVQVYRHIVMVTNLCAISDKPSLLSIDKVSLPHHLGAKNLQLRHFTARNPLVYFHFLFITM